MAIYVNIDSVRFTLRSIYNVMQSWEKRIVQSLINNRNH